MTPVVKSGLFLAALIAASLVPVSCSGRSTQDPVVIGVLTDCRGGFATAREQSLAGAELPLLLRGGSRLGSQPSDGISDVTVAGRPVRLALACEAYSDRRGTIDALTTLVEQEHADIVISPPFTGDGIAVREFARRHPGRTFMMTNFDQSPMMKRPAANTFRFELDAAQWGAGSGRYAHDTLRWRRPAVIGDSTAAAWPVVAGIVADVCAAGGRTPKKLWPSTSAALTRDAARLQTAGVDGAFLPGVGLEDPAGFVRAWRSVHPDLGRHLLVGWAVLSADPSLVGVVGSSPDPWATPPAWRRYSDSLDRWFPKLGDGGLNNQPYYDAVEPVLQALELVHGDLSGHQARFMDALANLRYASPEGLIHLDEHHRAIGPMYFGKVVNQDGVPTIRQIATIRDVEPTMSGQFGPTTPAPSRESQCRSSSR